MENEVSARITPHRSEISEAMEAYVVRRLSVDSGEWRENYQKELRQWRRQLWLRRFRRLSFKLQPSRARVREAYSSRWTRTDYPSPADATAPAHLYDWHAEGLELRSWGIKRIHQRMLWRCMKELRPRSVLEVGFGNGLNLLALSTAFPGVRWAGIELSPVGVARAREMQREPELLPAIAQFCSWPNNAPQAYRNIDFQEGDASRLPFDDRSFDLVFTLVAVAHMEEIRDAAVAELARVSGKWVIMVEPLAEFNREPLRSVCTRAKGFFSLGLRDLKRFGLEPVFVFDDIPQRITRAVGLVLARKL